MTKIITLTLATFIGFVAFGQKPNDRLIRDYFKNNTTKIDLQKSTANDIRLDRKVEDKKNGLTHFYVQQTLNGLPVINCTAVLVKKRNVLLMSGNRLISGEKQLVEKSSAAAANEILSIVWEEISNGETLIISNLENVEENKFKVNDSRISEVEIPIQLAYFYDGTSFRLIYETSMKVPDQDHWWKQKVRAA